MKHLTIISVALLSFCLFSCNKDDLSGISPSSTLINFEGEGGQKKISFTNGDWEIAKVVNQNNNQKIFGDIYSINGNIVQRNHLLELDSLGRLEAVWSDKGFKIIRKTPTSIEVRLRENFTKKDFGFTIVLKSDKDLKRIKVNQKPSQGYKVESIKYTLEENDGDSIFSKLENPNSFDINASISPTVSFPPFVNNIEISQFESDEGSAFPWKQADSVMVKVPTKISGNKVLTNGEESPYSDESIVKDSKFKNKQTPKITIPLGKSKFFIKKEYRKRRVTYTLRLINNRTHKSKIVTGKWIETAPTGNYEIDWK